MRSIFGVLTNGWPRHAGALNRRSSTRMNRKFGRASSFASSGAAAMAPSASLLDRLLWGMTELFDDQLRGVEIKRGVLHVQALQRLHDDLRDRQVAKPLFIRRDHIPRRFL